MSINPTLPLHNRHQERQQHINGEQEKMSEEGRAVLQGEGCWGPGRMNESVNQPMETLAKSMNESANINPSIHRCAGDFG